MCGGGAPDPAPKADPEAERLQAAADAQASANAKIVADKRRRRTQANLLGTLSDGMDTLGNVQTAGATVLGAAGPTAASSARTASASLLSVAAPPAAGSRAGSILDRKSGVVDA